MYIPKSFSETDPAILYDFMQRNNFATLVSQAEDGMVASHIPLMIDAARSVLIGHLARANSQWQSFASGREVLVIFQGPHTYVSPSWYETAPSVPTWNYAVVHAYGVPRIIDDPAAMRDILKLLVDNHEQYFEPPWTMDLPPDYLHKMMQAIVGFEIPIARLEGKFKLNQNRSETDQRRVMDVLNNSAYEPDNAVGALMQRRLGEKA